MFWSRSPDWPISWATVIRCCSGSVMDLAVRTALNNPKPMAKSVPKTTMPKLHLLAVDAADSDWVSALLVSLFVWSRTVEAVVNQEGGSFRQIKDLEVG